MTLESSFAKVAVTLHEAEGNDDTDDLQFEPLLGTNGTVIATSTMPAAIFNLSNTIVGAGVLALPFAFANTGIVIGPLVLFSVYAMVVVSCRMLVHCSSLCSARSYAGVARAALGHQGVLATQLSIIVACFGTCTGYLVIVGDMMSPLIGEWMGGSPGDFCSPYAHRHFSISLALLIVVPLSLARHLDSLKYTSYLALTMVLYLVVIVVIRSKESLDQGPGEKLNFLNLSETIFRAVPIVTLAFTCQMNLFGLLTTLENPTRRRVRRVMTAALSVCLAVYVLVGLFGYLTFFDEAQGNVLLNYEVDDTAVMVGRLGVAIVVLCSYPLLMHPCLDNLFGLIFPKREFSLHYRVPLAIVTIGLTYTIAMLVRDVSLVLGVAGAIGSTSMSFILPPAFILRLSPAKMSSRRKVVAVAMLILGVVFAITSTVVTFIDAATDPSDELDLSDVCNRTAARARE